MNRSPQGRLWQAGKGGSDIQVTGLRNLQGQACPSEVEQARELRGHGKETERSMKTTQILHLMVLGRRTRDSPTQLHPDLT